VRLTLIRPLAEPPAVAHRQRLVPSPIETEPEPRDQVDSEPFRQSLQELPWT